MYNMQSYTLYFLALQIHKMWTLGQTLEEQEPISHNSQVAESSVRNRFEK